MGTYAQAAAAPAGRAPRAPRWRATASSRSASPTLGAPAVLGAVRRPEAARADRARARRRAGGPVPRRAHGRRRSRRRGARSSTLIAAAEPRARPHRRPGEPPPRADPRRSCARSSGSTTAGRRKRPIEAMLAPRAARRRSAARRGDGRMSTLARDPEPGLPAARRALGSVLVGLVCPLVGVYFVLRRMIFLGVALPQVSAAGIAFSFLAYRLLVGPHEHGRASASACSRMVGSFGFTLSATLVLAALERRGRETRRGAHRRHLRDRRGGDDPLPRRGSARRRADGEPAEGRHPRHHQRQPDAGWRRSSASSCSCCSPSARSCCWSRSIATWRSSSASAPACGTSSSTC